MQPPGSTATSTMTARGCIETTRETTHNEPVYEVHRVIHYAVGNMPGAVPYTSTYALTNATLPYILEVAMHGARGACEADPALVHGVNTVGGQVTNGPVAEFLGLPSVDPIAALTSA
jgi:alanine dehydrogenase